MPRLRLAGAIIAANPTAVRLRFATAAVVDCLCWSLALALALAGRYQTQLSEVDWSGLVVMIPVVAGIQVALGFASGLYRGRFRYGSFDEFAALGGSVALTAILAFAVDRAILLNRPVPVSTPLTGGYAAVFLMAIVRYEWRRRIERARRPSHDGLSRLLIFGAGEGGHQVITAMLRDPKSNYLPVGLLDDDPTKRHLTISGVKVSGTRESMAAVAERLCADALLVAIPSAGRTLITELTDLASAVDLPVKVLPQVSELYGAGVGVGDIRDLQPSDLLGRRQIDTDVGAIAGYVRGKRVLVTGAGGSIGSELCRQLHAYEPSELIMLDRDESALHAVQLSIEGRALLDSPNLMLADIRDKETIRGLFSERRPHVVFHAAALKHLPLLENAPGEAVKTNVWGTLSVLEASAAAGVERFVNISTDKAADPISVLGYSKRIAERLTAAQGATGDGVYLSVRFGNVLGSRGSVLTTFRAQVADGGPLTVTHPDVTRYFMTVPEAVQLVIQAGVIGKPAETLILDMGQPVRIADVARRMAARAPDPIDIVYTGLRPGEKLDEDLFHPGEEDRRPVHPLISHVQVPPLSPVDALTLEPWGDKDALVRRLRLVAGARLSHENVADIPGTGRADLFGTGAVEEAGAALEGLLDG